MCFLFSLRTCNTSYSTINLMSSSSEKRTCPCKNLPLCLSSFTAAEYGDLHTLAKMGPAVADRKDEAGYTPLHLSAQNGHVAATSLLIQMGCSVSDAGGVTPLHRAAFSGATATIRILLQSPDCDLMARDLSFGDEMTPLHKAAAGGRYLAVQLLIEALKDKELLSIALNARDKSDKTPLEVAKYFRKRQDEERQAVARWDQVAGGVADWDKCTELLVLRTTTYKSTSGFRALENQQSTKQLYPPIPAHLTTREGCIDCGNNNDNGVCLTASWQAAFQAALGNSVDFSLQTRKQTQQEPVDSASVEQTTMTSGKTSNFSRHTRPDPGNCDLKNSHKTGSETSDGDGVSCCVCGKISIALYPSTVGLICKACKRNASR